MRCGMMPGGHEQQDFALAAEMGVRFRAVLQAGREPWMVTGQLSGRPVAAKLKTLVEIEPVAGQTLLKARRFDRPVSLLHENETLRSGPSGEAFAHTKIGRLLRHVLEQFQFRPEIQALDRMISQ